MIFQSSGIIAMSPTGVILPSVTKTSVPIKHKVQEKEAKIFLVGNQG